MPLTIENTSRIIILNFICLKCFLDASLNRLQKKLTEGSSLETGERGANKVKSLVKKNLCKNIFHLITMYLLDFIRGIEEIKIFTVKASL